MNKLIVAAALALAVAAPAAAAGQDFNDRQDFAFAERGFVGTRSDPRILAADGSVVWDLATYDFLKGPAPAGWSPRPTSTPARSR
jgi:alkyl sulfatase BDS1-like metallo-beta-lactamase superfamily hydrolase